MHSFNIGVDSNKVARCCPSPQKHICRAVSSEKKKPFVKQTRIYECKQSSVSFHRNCKLIKPTKNSCKFRAKQEQSLSPNKLGKTGSLGIQDHMA